MNGEATSEWAEAVETMRPHLRAFMPGTAARIAWKAEERLIAMIWSHLSMGKSSIGETCWMPALLTRMSGPPKAEAARPTRSAISAGLVMSAGEKSARTPNSVSMAARAASISSPGPKPLRTTFAPSAAKARAQARPMPLVEPVTRADLPLRVMEVFREGAGRAAAGNMLRRNIGGSAGEGTGLRANSAEVRLPLRPAFG